MTKKKLNIRTICYIALFFLQIAFVVYYGNKKEGFFTDEVFSYEGAKNDGTPLTYWDKEPGFYGDWHCRSELYDHMTYQKSNSVLRGEYNIIELYNNKELYYVLLNIAQHFSPGKLSIWPAIVLNLFFIIIAEIIAIYFINILCENPLMPFLTILWFGLSAGGISVVLYARVYALLILLNMLSMLFVYRGFSCNTINTKIIYGAAYVLVGLLSIKAHQFGAVLFILTGVSALITYFVFFKPRFVFLLIPVGLVLFGAVIHYININSSSFYMQVFMDRFSSLNIDCVRIVNYTLIKHFFGNSIIFRIIAFLVFVSACLCIRYWKENRKLLVFEVWVGIILTGFWLMLVLGQIGGSWRYVSPIYLLLIMFILIMFSRIQVTDRYKIWLNIFWIVIILSAVYFTQPNVSELYQGQKNSEEFFQTNYPNEKGLFIMGDEAGENYLYDAAFLWPDNSKVYVDKYSDFITRESYDDLFPERSMILWVTKDFKADILLQEFLNRSRYDKAEEVFTSDTLRVFKCSNETEAGKQ